MPCFAGSLFHVPRMRRFRFSFWLTNLPRCLCLFLCAPAPLLSLLFLPHPLNPAIRCRFSLKLINVSDAFKSFWWTSQPYPLIPSPGLRSASWCKNKTATKTKKKKKNREMGKKWNESGTIFVFYAIFTDDCHHVWVTARELAPFSAAAWFANRFATLFMSVGALLIISISPGRELSPSLTCVCPAIHCVSAFFSWFFADWKFVRQLLWL